MTRNARTTRASVPARESVVGGRLSGKVVAITGAAAGIGFASAQHFSAEGARLFLLDVDGPGGLRCRDQVLAAGGEAEFMRTDATNEGDVAAAFAALDARFGVLHVMFNCAGGSTTDDDAVDRLSLAVLHETFERDLQSAVLCSRSALPHLVASGGGSVINMSSFVAFRGTVRTHAYVAAKGAISAFTRTMAGTYAASGIRVNAIAPGVAMGERTRRRITESNFAAALTFDFGDYPFLVGVPDDIAMVALFLASDESRMITGQTIMADGGVSAY